MERLFPVLSTISGELDLCKASELVSYQACCLDWSSAWEPEHPDRKVWEGAVPFGAIPNGDYLAFKPDLNACEPPVAYLSHDGGGYSCIISESFDQFLEDWEKIHYVGADICGLAPFLDPKNGYLNPALPAKQEWDAILGLFLL